MKGRSTKKSASKATTTSSATTPSRQINVWTDGACLANGQKGARAGIGVYFSEGDARNLSERLSGERQTNQRAEMMASIRAIEIIRAGHKAESERKEKNPVATKEEIKKPNAQPAQSELLVKFPPILLKSQVETLAGKTEEETTKKRKKMSSKSIDLSANAMSEDSTEELATGKKKRKTKATKLNLTEDSSNNNEDAIITLSPISVIPKRLPPLIKPIPFPSALSPISLVTQKTAPIPSAPVDATSSNNSNDSAAIASPPPPLLVRVHTDSKYVINGVMSWMPNWKANQWRRGKGKPTEKNAIVNLDLWQRLDRLIIGSNATNTNQASATIKSASNSAGEVLFEWIHVEGHSGDVGNEAADKLAKSACQLEEVARNGVGE